LPGAWVFDPQLCSACVRAGSLPGGVSAASRMSGRCGSLTGEWPDFGSVRSKEAHFTGKFVHHCLSWVLQHFCRKAYNGFVCGILSVFCLWTGIFCGKQYDKWFEPSVGEEKCGWKRSD